MNLKTFTPMLALLLVACAGNSTRAEPKRLLLAYDGPTAQAALTTQPRLVVRAVGVPDYLDRRELVRRVSATQIKSDETALWAERPGKSITRWVTLALAAQRADYSVESYTTADGRAPDALLAITLESFEPDADGAVHLRGSWVYAPFGKVASKSGRFDADTKVSDGSAEAHVAALQQALGNAVKNLAAQLPSATLAPEPRR